MLKPEVRILAKKIIARMDEVFPDAGLIFLSYWQRPGEEDSHTIIHGDQDLVQRCFSEMEQTIRTMERCNINPSEKHGRELQEVVSSLAEDGDPQIVALFQELSDLLLMGRGDSQSAPYFGEAIIVVGRMELGIYFRKYAEFVGMARGVVSLFNAGIDSFRKLYPQSEEQL